MCATVRNRAIYGMLCTHHTMVRYINNIIHFNCTLNICIWKAQGRSLALPPLEPNLVGMRYVNISIHCFCVRVCTNQLTEKLIANNLFVGTMSRGEIKQRNKEIEKRIVSVGVGVRGGGVKSADWDWDSDRKWRFYRIKTNAEWDWNTHTLTHDPRYDTHS